MLTQSSPAGLAHELADVQLAVRAHLGVAGVADVRVVRPDDDLRRRPARLEVPHELLERLAHVRVAQVPRRHRAAVHLPVVVLGVEHQPGVLLGEEVVVLREPPVLRQQLLPALAQVEQLLHDLLLARGRVVHRHRMAVVLALALEQVEAGVPLARVLGRVRLVPLQVVDDRVHRRAHAVEVEAVEADLGLVERLRVVEGAQPLQERDDVGVAPHPAREPAEVGQRLARVGVGRLPAHPAVHPVGVRPVRLDRDGGEALLVDQPPGDAGPLAVELVGPVGGLADEDEATIPRCGPSARRSHCARP